MTITSCFTGGYFFYQTGIASVFFDVKK